MTEAVVGLPATGIGEHLVCLGDGTEPGPGLRIAADVGVELTGEAAERLLDVCVARIARNAEERVVVVLRRCHQAAPYTSSTRRDSSYAAARTERIAFS